MTYRAHIEALWGVVIGTAVSEYQARIGGGVDLIDTERVLVGDAGIFTSKDSRYIDFTRTIEGIGKELKATIMWLPELP